MRAVSALIAFFALLPGLVGPAAAAVDYVPRMERVAACNWDRPGHNPFMGDVVAAIDRYSDIPTLARIKLKQRMKVHEYDDLVDIRRDEIRGRERYDPTIRDMHFGLDRVCRQVTRERWTSTMHERGLVYCEQGYCILVPTICRNVSRIDRRPTLVAAESIDTLPPEDALAIAAPRVAPTATSSDSLSEPSASRQPTATSSFAEAVAGAVVPLWPPVGESGDPADPPLPPGFGPAPWWPPVSGGSGGGGLPVTAVPEPSTWVSLLAGLALLLSAQRRRGRRAAPR